MSAESCPHFGSCNAPLCPLDPASLNHCAWFPDEATCHRIDLRGAPWIVRQRKIARAPGAAFEAGSFTHRMLSQDTIVRRGIAGLDPDRGPPDGTEADWLKAHSARRQHSIEERAAARLRLTKKGRQDRGGTFPGAFQKGAPETPAAQPDLFWVGGAVSAVP